MKYYALALLFSAGALSAQTPTLTCDHQSNWDKQVTHCELQEQKLASFSQITVDGKTNGGVAVKAWDHPDILVRAKVEAAAETDGAARALYSQVIVHSTGGAIAADGPSTGHWSVSYEIFVPAHTDLNLTAHNGGISITGVEGHLEFQTHNGGIHLAKVAGDVRGHTQNGGIHVDLGGTRWNGAGLDVRSQNGGVHMVVPANYSAHLETSTVNGGVHSDLPNMVLDRRQRELRMDLGSGGAPVRVTTTNGGVTISHNSPSAL
jgi:hypothetical protein